MSTMEERFVKKYGFKSIASAEKLCGSIIDFIRTECERAAKEAVEEYDKELFLNGKINCVNVTSEFRKAALSKYGIKGE